MLLPLLILTLVARQHLLVTDPDAYDVYAVAIRSEWPDVVAQAKRLVINDTVGSGAGDCFPSGEPLNSGPWKEAVADYLRQNRSPKTLIPAFPLERAYTLVPLEYIRSLIASGGDWRPFYAAYPDSSGYFTMSSVGFDTTKTPHTNER